jgi:hypothetical protein
VGGVSGLLVAADAAVAPVAWLPAPGVATVAGDGR